MVMMKQLYRIDYWRDGYRRFAYRFAREPEEALDVLAERVPRTHLYYATVCPAGQPRTRREKTIMDEFTRLNVLGDVVFIAPGTTKEYNSWCLVEALSIDMTCMKFMSDYGVTDSDNTEHLVRFLDGQKLSYHRSRGGRGLHVPRATVDALLVLAGN